jgi:HEAT repeat protein
LTARAPNGRIRFFISDRRGAVEKKPFERVGNYYRFKHGAGAGARAFEFYHEPFEGGLSENIDLFARMYESGEPGRMQQGVNFLAQSKDERAIPHLIKAVNDNKFTGRAIAAAGLANFPGNRKVMKALVGTFKSADYVLTMTAINVLGKLGLAGAKKPLRKVLARCLKRDELFTAEKTAGPASALALACIASLMELDDEEHRPLLLRFLAHPVWEVKHQAAKVFARFPDREAEPLLRRLADDGNPMVQLGGAEALVRLGNEGGYEIMEQLLSEPEPGVRAAVLGVLAGFETEPAYDIMERALEREPDIGLRLEMTARLRASGRDVGLHVISVGLEHENPFVRQTAVRVAGDLGKQAELSLLREAMETEPDEFLKEQMRRKAGLK